MVKFLDNSLNRPDTEAAKDQRGQQNCSKPIVIRKFNVSWEKIGVDYF